MSDLSARECLQRNCTSPQPYICKSVKLLPTCTKRPCNIFMTIFRNAGFVRIVTSSSGYGESQSAKYISCIFEAKFCINGAIICAALLAHEVFGWPFVKRFALSYWTVVSLCVCLWRSCIVAKRLDGSRCCLVWR